ncbi:GSU2403 family nucleotidyltransferase fold protein [Methylobacter tundripaludum]|uniref:GSU2403 family nucleotidyltransferase fold protein n=1 Tax=Methylobacter tundripaludum TaxID=173365 RepID=UPI0004DF0B9E|nr:GSU2403 family nucleotidyltransferase fold protein [Methylobacter tundripaludum]
MNQQDALTTSLYSYLFEEALANESITICPGMHGSFSKETRRNNVYWYWVGRNNGKVTRIYIGADNKESEALIVSLENRKDMAKLAIASMKRTAAAYRGAGGQLIEPSTFKILAPLAYLFRKGVFVIGSHGFLSICNALGISPLTGDDMKSISLAIPDERKAVSDISPEFDENFFKGVGKPLSSKTKVHVFTADRGSKKPVYFDDLGVAAEPLRFIDYLLGGEPFKGLVIGSYAIPVHLPNPARFAIHKLIISQCADRSFNGGSEKDIAQAAVLLDYLIRENAEQVVDALATCLAVDGAVDNIRQSLVGLGAVDEKVAVFVGDQLTAKKAGFCI